MPMARRGSARFSQCKGRFLYCTRFTHRFHPRQNVSAQFNRSRISLSGKTTITGSGSDGYSPHNYLLNFKRERARKCCGTRRYPYRFALDCGFRTIPTSAACFTRLLGSHRAPTIAAYALNSLLDLHNLSREKDPIVTIGYVPTSSSSLVTVFSNQRLC